VPDVLGQYSGRLPLVRSSEQIICHGLLSSWHFFREFSEAVHFLPSLVQGVLRTFLQPVLAV